MLSGVERNNVLQNAKAELVVVNAVVKALHKKKKKKK